MGIVNKLKTLVFRTTKPQNPTTLTECFPALLTLLDDSTVNQIRDCTEDEMPSWHFSLGMWLRNNWGLWQDSPLKRWFESKGIYHADDMSGIILDSFWRHLHGKPIELESQIKYYQDYWDRQEKSSAD